jgi:hypothetical protein
MWLLLYKRLYICRRRRVAVGWPGRPRCRAPHRSPHRCTSSGCRCHRQGGWVAEVEPERSRSPASTAPMQFAARCGRCPRLHARKRKRSGQEKPRRPYRRLEANTSAPRAVCLQLCQLAQSPLPVLLVRIQRPHKSHGLAGEPAQAWAELFQPFTRLASRNRPRSCVGIPAAAMPPSARRSLRLWRPSSPSFDSAQGTPPLNSASAPKYRKSRQPTLWPKASAIMEATQATPLTTALPAGRRGARARRDGRRRGLRLRTGA